MKVPNSPKKVSSRNGIIFSHLNICSIPNKLLFVYANLRDNAIDILSINETWLTSAISNSSLLFSDYQFFRLDRNYSHGGGILLLVKKCLPALKRNTMMSQVFELQHVEIKVPFTRPLNIISKKDI